MKRKNAIFTAIFKDYEMLNDNLPYRRLHLIDVRNHEGILIKDQIFINETEELQLDINENKIICFLAEDKTLENIIKFYPYPKRVAISEKLKERRENERNK